MACIPDIVTPKGVIINLNSGSDYTNCTVYTGLTDSVITGTTNCVNVTGTTCSLTGISATLLEIYVRIDCEGCCSNTFRVNLDECCDYVEPVPTGTPQITTTPTVTETPSVTVTSTITPSVTGTLEVTITPTITPSLTGTPEVTPTPTTPIIVLNVGGSMEPCAGGAIDDHMGAFVNVNLPVVNNTSFDVTVYYEDPPTTCSGPFTGATLTQSFTIEISAGQTSSDSTACSNGVFLVNGANICGACITFCSDPSINLSTFSC